MLSREVGKEKNMLQTIYPTSKWRLEWVEPFCDLQFTDLGFTKDDLQNVELLPEVKVFAKCTATMDDIAEGAWELDLNHVQNPVIDACWTRKSAAELFV